MNYESCEVVIIVDSDTYWTDTTLNILKPFQNKKVGGVTGMHLIFNEDKTFSRRIASWMERLRFSLVLPAQSIFGAVFCLPGRTMAFRSSVFQKAVKALVNQRILGVDIVTGDDRELTTQVLKQGYKTVYQSDSIVYTDAPNTSLNFAKQQLRWYISVIRETLANLFFYFRKSPVAAFWSLEFIFSSLFFVGIVAATIIKYLTGYNELIPSATPANFLENIWIHILLTILGLLVGYYIRQYMVLRQKPSNVFLMPLFILFMLFILLPVKIIATFSFMEQGWNTRKNATQSDPTQRFNILMARTTSFAWGLILTLIIIPVVFLYEISYLEIPADIVLAGEGIEYYYEKNNIQNEILVEETPITRVQVVNNDVKQKVSSKTIIEEKIIKEDFVYVAKSGDSYISIALNALKDYESDRDIRFENWKRTYIATVIGNNMNSKPLLLNDVVVIRAIDIENFSDDQLSEFQINYWKNASN